MLIDLSFITAVFLCYVEKLRHTVLNGSSVSHINPLFTTGPLAVPFYKHL